MNPQAAAQHLLDPFPWYRQQRETAPVSQDPRGVWMVFGYDDVQRVLSDYASFSSSFGRDGDSLTNPLGASIISTDPPRHRQLRSLVTQAFTPRTVAQLEPRIAAIVDELLDAVVARGTMDIVDDFAYPLPVIVIAELLGIPAADRARFKQWSDAVVTGPPAGTEGRNLSAEMNAYFMEMIEQRKREPRNDLISGLLAARIEDQHLSLVELLGFCVLLLVAGNETTTNLIGNAILCLDEHPDALERLRADPTLLPSAIEEVLRYRSPVQSMFRSTAAEVTLGEHAIPAGRPVIAWIGSANRDGVQFPDPDRFDIARSPNRHLAFGHGIHFCLGAPLARLEARIALTALLTRLPALRRNRDVALEPLTSSIVFGVKHLPVVFEPSHRS